MKVGILFKYLIILAFVCNVSTAAFPQEQPPAAPSVEEQHVEVPESSAEEKEAETGIGPSVAEAETTKPGNVTMIFKDADIKTVLHALSYKSGVNIVAAADVEAKVTIRLIDVPWETALQVILKNYGFTYEREGNIIRVTTLESVAKEELQSEVHVLNYSKAKEISESIKEMLTDRGKVKYDERTNAIVVTDIPTNLYKVKEVIKRLDKRTPQIAIESKLIETTLDKDDKLGIDWTVKATVSAAKRPTTFPFDREEPPFAWSKGEGQKEGVGRYLPLGKGDDFPSNISPILPYTTATNFTFGTLNFSEFQAVLQLLGTRTDTKVISNPAVTTLDNCPAKVNVSTIFNIPKYERNSTTGAMEITGYTEKDIGVVMTVTPHVNEAGDIIVDLKPEVSAFSQWDTFGTGTNAIYAPRFTTRTAETQVMIKDGQTIAMGGLMKETVTKYKNKVPILGDIPLIGELFKKTEDSIDTVDLLIFVTVRLIKEDQDDKTLAQETEKRFHK